MSQQRVRFISDPFRFARESRLLEGELPVTDLVRLEDILADQSGMIHYRIVGMLDAEQRAFLKVEVKGELMLRCQRCLEGLRWVVDLSSVLQPVPLGHRIPEEELEDNVVDALEVGGEMEITALIEDEILLEVPLAFRHEECDVPHPERGENEDKSPFAMLALLRDKKA